MILFEGDLSEQCVAWLTKGMKRSAVTAGVVSIAVISIPIVLMGIFLNKLIFLFLVLSGILIVLFAIALPKDAERNVMNNIPIRVEIEATGLAIETQTAFVSRSMEDVKQVLDFGEWYQITFYFGYRNSFFICQKDLIKEGTIEEFEAMFADKMERKV